MRVRYGPQQHGTSGGTTGESDCPLASWLARCGMKTPPALSEACCLNAPLPRRRLFEVLARWWPVELLLLLGLPAAMSALVGVIFYHTPTTYESSSLIEIAPSPTPAQVVDHTPVESALTTEYLATQAVLIKSGGCLERVVEALDLAKQWNLSQGGAINALKQRLTVTVLPKTHLIRITARASDPLTARDLAAQTVVAYKHSRQAEGDKQLQMLEKAVRSQEDTAEQTRKVLAQIIKARQIIVVDDAGGTAPVDDHGLATLRAKQTEMELAAANLAATLNSLEKSPFEHLVAHAKADAGLVATYRRYLQIQQWAEKHKDGPSEVRDPLTQQLDELHTELESHANLLKATLRGDLALATAKLESIRSQTDAIAKQHAADALSRTDYYEARSYFQRESAQLERMHRQLIQQQVQLRTASESVRVCEEPEPADHPTNFNFGRGLRRAIAVGLLAAVLLMVPFALLLEGFSTNRRMKRLAAAAEAPPTS